jgi:hypothetical protein
VQKIPTIFVRDETKKGHPVLDQVKPECQWVLDGEGVATEKMDGTNVKIENGKLLKRQKPKDRDYDEASYAPCRRDDPADRWAFEAFDALVEPGGMMHSDVAPPDGIYELVGPKVQSNPHDQKTHRLICVVPFEPSLNLGEVPRSFEGLRAFLDRITMEGIVFHHPDGRLAKIKRRDFGLPWPASK